MINPSTICTYKIIVNTWPWFLKSRFVILMSSFPVAKFSQTLYAGTIWFNVLLGAAKPHTEVTQKEIEDACRSANILDFINGLPKFVSFPLMYISCLG